MFRKIGLLLLFFATLLLATKADAESYPNRMSRAELMFQGVKREYWLHVPRNGVFSDAPLLLVLHDGNGSATAMQRDTGWNKLSAQEGFFVAYPEGLDGGWNDGRELSSIRSQRDGVDDVGFLVQVVADIAEHNQVDKGRIYVVGGADGGLMALRLACERPDLFAAIASVSGAMSEKLAANCAMQEAIPVLFVNGTDDPYIPFLSRGRNPINTKIGRIYSAADSARYWARRNGCSEKTRQHTIPKVDIQSVTAVEEFTFENCGGAEVILYGVVGGRHSWPGARASSVGQLLSDRVLGKAGMAISATELIWKFLSRQRKPGFSYGTTR